MKYIGAHVDATPTIWTAPEEAHALGANAFALNLTAPQRWSTPQYSEEDVERFRSLCSAYGFGPGHILPHSAFVVNLGSPDARKLHLSRVTFVDELRRCSALGIDRLNFHPGSHLRQISEDESLARVAESINYALERTERVTAVIENTAGQGSALGYSFEHLAHIIDGVDDKSRVGVCIDTCHACAAGYELTGEGYERTWADFDRIVGFGYLRGMHINDAMHPTGSRIDRHAPIGKGTLGSDFFGRLMSDCRLDHIPLILETPDASLWKAEIDWLRAHDSSHE